MEEETVGSDLLLLFMLMLVCVLLFYVPGKQLWSYRDDQLT